MSKLVNFNSLCAAVLHTLPAKYENSLNFCGLLYLVGTTLAFVRYGLGKKSVKGEPVSNVKA